MARHVLSVCIFCFICATHSPCASHVDLSSQTNQNNSLKLKSSSSGFSEFQEYILQRERYKSRAKLLNNTYKGIKRMPYSNKQQENRIRRDLNNIKSPNGTLKLSDSYHNNEPNFYLKQIFSTYGDGTHMSIEGFRKLLNRFDLVQDMYLKLKSSSSSQTNENQRDINETENKRKCINQDILLKSIEKDVMLKNQTKIDNHTFKIICPAILYSLVAENCADEPILNTNFSAPLENHISVWFYSTLAVLIISGCGILGLAVIPIMQNKFYQPLLQFLVALAVGTLAGDALLHLLPHAMLNEVSHTHTESHSHDHDDLITSNHDDNMWKGFVAMMGLIFFFFMERLITLGAKWRKHRQLRGKMPSRLKVMKAAGAQDNPGEKQCKHKYSSFPMCYEEIKMLDKSTEDHVFRLAGGTDCTESHNNTATTTLDEIGSNSDIVSLKVPRLNHHIKIETNQNMTECPNDVNNINCTEANKMLSEENVREEKDSVEYTVILREHETQHHGHTHSHGHVHSAPKNMSSVAWMVIMGDGLHNFTDGMAIGAAFTGSIAGGFSTAVAVFCHELPHELGDFAMLLKAGMTMKQALFYNLLSSILCFFGNAFGVWLGNTEYGNQWIFAVASGMFLYIALVDMIPELSSGHENQETFFQCVLHLSGLLLGFGIMALIAFYEHDLKNIFFEPI